MRFLLIFTIFPIIVGDISGIIGIFSAPENFLKRYSIRNTWIKQIKNSDTINYKFVIGNVCQLPLENRLDIYGCNERPIVKRNATFTTLVNLSNQRVDTCANGFAFVSNENLVVTHIGVTKRFIEFSDLPVRVKLKDALTGQVLSSVTFYDRGIHLKSVTPIVFPRGAEGVLKVESEVPKYCNKLSPNQLNILTLTSVLQGDSLIPVEFDIGTFAFIEGKFIGETHIDENHDKEFERNDIIKNLKLEQRHFNDILFVNVTDVYRNLPRKLIKFLETVNRENVSFVIKTDDDSMLDIGRIYGSLRLAPSQEFWWWSYFKQYWAVPRLGKWRDTAYKSVTYPPFPCGGGYVLSKRVTEYIASNKDNLMLYQGEDVAIGIWLSGLQMDKLPVEKEVYQSTSYLYRAIMEKHCEDPCSWTCDSVPLKSNKPRCNAVQLTVDQMFNKWFTFLNTGHL